MVFQSWSSNELLSFFMVFVRIGILMSVLPIFGDRAVPAPVKILLSIAMTTVLFPLLRGVGAVDIQQAAIYGQTTGKLLSTVVSEILVGLALGFSAQLVFQTVSVAGDVISQLIGVNAATAYDPHQESQSVLVSQVLGALAMLTFLSMNGHHALIETMIESFRSVGIGQFTVNEGLKMELIRMTGNSIAFGLQLAAPIALIMMFVNIVYGILAKTLPQLNILTLSMAASLFVGLGVLTLSYPAMNAGLQGLFLNSVEDMKSFLKVLGKG